METLETLRTRRKDVQAKNISDARILRAVKACFLPTAATAVTDVLAIIGPFPPKVVAAKLRALSRRGLIREAGRVVELTDAGEQLLK